MGYETAVGDDPASDCYKDTVTYFKLLFFVYLMISSVDGTTEN
jgi:hypothetical protein